MTFAGPVVEVAEAAMGTVFAVQLSDPTGSWEVDALRAEAHRALTAVHDVERVCSRFDATSELRRLSDHIGEPVPGSPLLVELLALALAIAEASDGAFDPTVGAAMLAHGFDRHWRTDVAVGDVGRVSPPRHGGWRDLTVDQARGTIRLDAAHQLDLGALAKGFAVDLVAAAIPHALSASIHAGGDVRCVGAHPEGRAWTIGVRSPTHTDRFAAVAHIADGAVCTSGDYERVNAAGVHHLLDPRTGHAATGFRSVSVVAPTAVVADGLATAAFVLGPARAADWLATQHVDALLIAPDAEPHTVTGAGTTTWELLPLDS
ncbi:MAG: FAD:protein FMN transferase [Gemmatimonadaceae bacterium]|nr:FAD:protein FMN transferase [Gemmatimonadaceae bacterium]